VKREEQIEGVSERACGMCGGKTFLYWKTAQIIRCETCSLLSRRRFPTEDELRELYSGSWERPSEHCAETGATDAEFAARYVQCLTASLGIESLKGLRLLEFGAGTGALMRALDAAGAEVYGVEPFGYSLLKSNGLNAFRDLSDLPACLVFDGILSQDVVEHLTEPWSVLHKFMRLLSPQGWIYLATPNAAGLNARLSRSNWRELKNPGHLTLFRPDSLEYLLRNNGFARYSRLHWQIVYGKGTIQGLKDSLLRGLKLDGELRYLAFPSEIQS